MKSLVFTLPLIALSLFSCADEDLTVGAGGNRIRFDVSSSDQTVASRSGSRVRSISPSVKLEADGRKTLYLTAEVSEGFGGASSRSSLTSSESISDFGVYAAYGSEAYMTNVKVTRANGWSPEDEYLWPGKGSLSFTAYSPYVTDPTVDSDGNVLIDWQTPADVASQQSLLRAEPVEASASPCSLVFHNALTAIRFIAGSELAPCTVRSISLKGIPSSGRLAIADGSWSEVGDPGEFTISPDLTLAADASTGFVAEKSLLAPEEMTLLMIPGTLPADASVSISLEIDGKPYDFTASIGGSKWDAGTLVTYRLSANPQTSGLTLDVDGNFTTAYPGQTVPFSVRSALVSDSGDSTAISWKAEFVDADGNLLGERPDWITTFPESGTGHDDLKAVTRMQDPTYLQLSKESQLLQNTPDINQTSGQTPYNLSNSTGAPAVENTANCYIVNAPGQYSFPLVYGNAIKDGADNKAAYTSTSHNALALKAFVNHLGNAITAPYISQNSGCTPSEAKLVWEGRLGLISDVTLSADRSQILFTVTPKAIRQGNALIAVYDADGRIMWSWNIWVTDYQPAKDSTTYTSSGTTYHYYGRNIGRIMGGDITQFPHCLTYVRFTQTNVPDGMEPLSKTIEFNQTGITVETTDSYNFYQWGRKDLIKSTMTEWFDADHYEITSLTRSELPADQASTDYMPAMIQNPAVFYKASHSQEFEHSNLWNTSLNTKSNVKSVYDPSPVGAKVPLGNGLLAMMKDASVAQTYRAATTGNHSMGLALTLPSGEDLFFPELGYRSGASGHEASGIGSIGTVWLAQTPGASNTAKTEARCIILTQGTISSNTNPRTHGFAVRPILE